MELHGRPYALEIGNGKTGLEWNMWKIKVKMCAGEDKNRP
jgi:ribosomal protein S28E/S33